MERNKQLLLADKYGCDTVECYSAEPLASDSEDEKRIKRAIKEASRCGMRRKREAAHQQRGQLKLICDRLSGTSYIRVPPFELQVLRARCE